MDLDAADLFAKGEAVRCDSVVALETIERVKDLRARLAREVEIHGSRSRVLLPDTYGSASHVSISERVACHAEALLENAQLNEIGEGLRALCRTGGDGAHEYVSVRKVVEFRSRRAGRAALMVEKARLAARTACL